MRNLCSLFVAIAILLCGGFATAAETNQIATNTASGNATNRVVPPNVADPELQAKAKGVLWMVLAFWVVALVGALVVAGFALYGAYKKFGRAGVAVVVVILILGLG